MKERNVHLLRRFRYFRLSIVVFNDRVVLLIKGKGTVGKHVW